MGEALGTSTLIREGLHTQSFFFSPRKKPIERLSADTGTSPPACGRAGWTALQAVRKGINKQEEKCMDIYNVDGRRTPPPPSLFAPPPCRFRAVFTPQNMCK